MTKAKPPGTSWTDWISGQIDDARRKGEFDGLQAEGRPLVMSDVGDDDWWIKQKMREEGLRPTLPPGLALRKKVADFRAGLTAFATEGALRDALVELNEEIIKANSRWHEGPPSNCMPFDVDEVVARWRASRSN